MSTPKESTRALESPPTLEVPSLVLAVVDGPDKGLRFEARGDDLRIGTATACHFKLGDPTVSRVHCEIRGMKVGFRIVDLDSTNGTTVDGVRIESAFLQPGARITMGQTVIAVSVAEERAQLPLPTSARFGRLVGASVEMRQIYAVLERVARTSTTILIGGETGTGKELVAQALHDASPRSPHPFVTVDCGAIAETLIESELFGHVRGAFSSAVADREGLFERADGGTLFLDEIGELPLSLQPKLLRVLESREVRRVGSNSTRKIDVRVVAATHRSLARGVNEGSFREDLYYRLAVVEIVIPPLRARRGDILPLARHFFSQFAGADADFPVEIAAGLLVRGWPGNVRELRNYVERLVTLGYGSDGSRPEPDVRQIPPELESWVPTDLPLKEARDRWTFYLEHVYVRSILRRAGGNVSVAARLAGVNRRWLHRLIEQVGLGGVVDPTDKDPPA